MSRFEQVTGFCSHVVADPGAIKCKAINAANTDLRNARGLALFNDAFHLVRKVGNQSIDLRFTELRDHVVERAGVAGQ